jgi:membrane protein DedA with SNARE-associated domain
VSAVAWNGLLVAIGYGLGTNLEAIETWLTRYTLAAWIFIIAMAIVTITRLRQAPGAAPGDGTEPQ